VYILLSETDGEGEATYAGAEDGEREGLFWIEPIVGAFIRIKGRNWRFEFKI
jgi:hypothetical protein